MYVARRNPLPDAVDDFAVSRRSWRGLIVERNVALLGMTSLVTDISSEMVAVVLPLYLTGRLGFTALQFGAADGFLGVATALTALAGALAAHRARPPAGPSRVESRPRICRPAGEDPRSR